MNPSDPQPRDRDAALERLGVAGPMLPEEIRQALGPRRSLEFERQIRDRVIDFDSELWPRDELSRMAKRLGPAVRALDVATSAEVVRLEEVEGHLGVRHRQRRDIEAVAQVGLDQAEAAQQAPGANPAATHRDVFGAWASLGHATHEADKVAQRWRGVRDELDVHSGFPGHPDRWVQAHGRHLIDSLAARHHLGREHATAREQRGQKAAAPAAVELPGESLGM